MFDDDCNVYFILEYMTDGNLWQKWKKQKVFDEKNYHIIEGDKIDNTLDR